MAHATQTAVLQLSLQYVEVYSLSGSAESHLIPLPSVNGCERSSFTGLVPSDAMDDSKSVAGGNSGDSSIVNRYQIHKFSSYLVR